MKIAIVGRGVGPSTFGVNKQYLDYARQINTAINGEGEPLVARVIFPYTTEIEKDIDLLIMPGGPDVLDIGSTPTVHNGNPDVYYEQFDKILLPQYIEAGIPVFGICRGFQALNIAFGGELHPELYNHPFSKDSEGRGHKVHDLKKTDFFCSHIDPQADRKKKMEVNSLHHQGVKKLATDFIATGVAKGKDWYYPDIVEGFIHRELAVAGVQWHPEETGCLFSIKMIKFMIMRNAELSKDSLKIILEQYEGQ